MYKDNNKELKKLKMQFIEKITDNMDAFGTPESIGKILGIIYMNRLPMTLDELSSETGMSKTRMSQVVREMIDMSIAERVFQKGIKKDFYEVENDYHQTFISIFVYTWEKAIRRSSQFERRIQTKIHNLEKDFFLNDEEQKELKTLKQELEEWKSYYDWINRITDFFKSGEIFEYIPK